MDIAFALERIKIESVQEYQAQLVQLFLWSPVFLACGIGVYFLLPVEPPVVLGVFACLCCVFIFVFLRRVEPLSALFILLLGVGFAVAQFRAHWIYTPVLQGEIGPVYVEGVVDQIEDLGEGRAVRLVLSDLVVERLSPDQTPGKVRLRLWKGDGVRVGQRVRLLAKLHPPSGPTIPGGFDFRRYLYFQGIGGVGFAFHDADILQDVRGGVFFSFRHKVESMRHEISQRVEEGVSYPQAGLLMALMIGRKTALAEEEKEHMRHAGLAHMLAISGLHVGLFSGVVFFAVRFFLVLIPGMALRYPIKKYAAVCAMVGALIYMFMAGATIPTMRAVMMSYVVLLAVIVDRTAISMRLVAFAALVVLLLFPESLLSASFQLSFSAVAGLVVFYSWLKPYWSDWYSKAGFIRKMGLYFFGVCATTIVATLATAPFSLYHFHEIPAYGLVGNILAMPILSFIIMPLVLISLVCMPFGLEAYPLWAAGEGSAWVLDIALWVSNFSHSAFNISGFPFISLILIVFSIFSCVLLKTWWRGISVIFFAASLFFIIIFNQYDIVISSSNNLVLFRPEEGGLYVSSLRKERFVRESWMAYYGADEDRLVSWPRERGDNEHIACDDAACRIQMRGYMISYLHKESAAPDECGFADVVVAPFPLRNCSAQVVIGLYEARRHGVHGIRLTPVDISVDSSGKFSGKRLWNIRYDQTYF